MRSTGFGRLHLGARGWERMGRRLTTEGKAALHAALAAHVASGAMPGLVALVRCGGDVHVEAIGHKDFGDAEPIGRDAIFRIASITKPMTATTLMLLVEDGAMALDDAVDRWIPELAGRRVLRSVDAELDDTVPAARPITVDDVLSFRLGYGSIMAPPAPTRSSGPRRPSTSRPSRRRGRRRHSHPTSGSPPSARSRSCTSPALGGCTTP